MSNTIFITSYWGLQVLKVLCVKRRSVRRFGIISGLHEAQKSWASQGLTHSCSLLTTGTKAVSDFQHLCLTELHTWAVLFAFTYSSTFHLLHFIITENSYQTGAGTYLNFVRPVHLSLSSLLWVTWHRSWAAGYQVNVCLSKETLLSEHSTLEEAGFLYRDQPHDQSTDHTSSSIYVSSDYDLCWHENNLMAWTGSILCQNAKKQTVRQTVWGLHGPSSTWS